MYPTCTDIIIIRKEKKNPLNAGIWVDYFSHVFSGVSILPIFFTMLSKIWKWKKPYANFDFKKKKVYVFYMIIFKLYTKYLPPLYFAWIFFLFFFFGARFRRILVVREIFWWKHQFCRWKLQFALQTDSVIRISPRWSSQTINVEHSTE